MNVADGRVVDVKVSVGDKVGEEVFVGNGVGVITRDGTIVAVGESTSSACGAEVIVGSEVAVDAGFNIPQDDNISVKAAMKIRKMDFGGLYIEKLIKYEIMFQLSRMLLEMGGLFPPHP